jgi:hypothetical protein
MTSMQEGRTVTCKERHPEDLSTDKSPATISQAPVRQPLNIATAAAHHRAVVLVGMMACAGLALSILTFFPGYLTRDATFVRGYVQTWYLGDWQSPLMTIVWWLIDPLSPGTGSIFLLAAVLYWLGFAITASAVARLSTGLAMAVLSLALAPPAFMLLAMIWRDILFATAWLLAAALIYFAMDRSWPASLSSPARLPDPPPHAGEGREAGGGGSGRGVVRGLALVLIGFGVLLRPNAIVAAPLLIAYAAWPARFEWKRVALLFIPALLAGYGLIQIVYYGILNVHRENPLHALIVFDLGAITHFTRENQFPVSWSDDGYEDALLITQCYDPAGWDSYWTRDPCKFVMVRLESKDDVVFGTPRLAWSWLRAVAGHPLVYLRHRLAFLWRFLAGANPTLELERMHLVDRVPLARNQHFLAIVALHDTLKSTPLFRVGTWLAFAAAVGALAWRGRATPAGTFAISVAASGIVYILSFGVLGVASDFRYAYWCVLASLAGLVPALLAHRDKCLSHRS